ncbi:MAG: tetratricopeptide repeat protein, partial [Chloroflexi bacterium]|nr:tetratricopeptide repeat protein [Chloroflexota bacterium]
RTRLSRPLLYRLGANQELVRLLEMLFPGGIDTRPPLGSVTTQAFAIGALARAYFYSGRLDIATELYRSNLGIVGGQKDSYRTHRRKYIVLEKYVEALTYGGYLYEADQAGREGLLLTLKQDDDIWIAGLLMKLGLLYQMRGLIPLTRQMLQKAFEIFEAVNRPTLEGVAHAYLGQWALRAGDYEMALQEAQQAYDLAEILRNEGHYLRAMRIQGVAYLHLGDVNQAEKLINEALQRVRHISYVEEEISIALALIDIAISQEQWQRAREAIDDIRETIERGPFPLFQADLLNRLAHIEHQTGNDAAALFAAAHAYELAWCDGGDYAYRQGMDTARQLLEMMGASPPRLSTSTMETLPDIDWDMIFARQVDWVDR